jgi:hypothetical protein
MSNMGKKQTPVTEATTPAPYCSDEPEKNLIYDPETGEFYEVPAGREDKAANNVITRYCHF